MIPKKIQDLVEKYCMGLTPTPEQEDEILDLSNKLGISTKDCEEVRELMTKLQAGPTREEAELLAREEAERKEKEEAERKLREEEEERKRKEAEAERKRKEEADRKRREEEERKRKEEEERKERKRKEEADRKERLETERIKADAEVKKAEAEARKAEAELQKKKLEAEEERKRKEEAKEERKRKEEADRKAKEEAERKRKEEAERKAREEEERKRKEEEERKRKEEAERKAKADAERRRQAEAERKARKEAERKADKRKTRLMGCLIWIVIIAVGYGGYRLFKYFANSDSSSATESVEQAVSNTVLPQDDEITCFCKADDESKYGIMNKKTNKVILEPKYTDVFFFEDGVAVVNIGEKAGLVNQKGEELLPCEYDNIFYSADDGVFELEKNEKYGFATIDANSFKVVLNCEYDYISSWDGGLAQVEKGDKTGYVNKKGEWVTPLQ